MEGAFEVSYNCQCQKNSRRVQNTEILLIYLSIKNSISLQPGQEVEISIVVSQEGNDFVYRHNLHVEFDDPLREVIEYETDPESETNTTLRPVPLSIGSTSFL